MFFGRQICVCLILQLWVIGFCLNLNNNDEEKVNLDSFSNNEDVVHATITVANTLHALEKIAFYYYKHKKEASVDFAFGMRAAEGKMLYCVWISCRMHFHRDLLKNLCYFSVIIYMFFHQFSLVRRQ